MNEVVKIKYGIRGMWIVLGIGLSACAHTEPNGAVPINEAARLERVLIRNSVTFDPGTEQGAVVPDVSAPSLHAVWVEEHREGNRLIEGHREWLLDGQIVLLGIPKSAPNKKGDPKNDETDSQH